MLNRDQIKARLSKGEIFVPGTWQESAIGGASYDLHIAKDFLISGGKTHPVGRTIKDIAIASGETALVSTQERFCMPWNLVGNMSPKFTLVTDGLLIHTGSIVDPGFGLRNVKGKWLADADERVHFFLVNVGARPITLRAGDPIATLQFADVKEPEIKRETTHSREKMHAKFFDASDGVDVHKKLSLAFFGLIKDFQEQAQNHNRKLDRRLTKLEGELKGALSGYQQVTIFGVYVLGAALLTMFGTILLDGGLGGVFNPTTPIWLQRTVAFGLVLAMVVPIVITFLMRGRRQHKDADELD